MTFADLFLKFRKFWPLLIIFPILINLVSAPFLFQEKYQAHVSYGLSVPLDESLQEDEKEEINFEKERIKYANLLEGISYFLVKQFASVQIQHIIAEIIGLETANLSENTPFYEVKNQDMGYVNLIYTGHSEEEVQRFIEGSNEGYEEIIAKWNENRPDEAKISAQDPDSQIIKLEPTIQEFLFPTIAGIIIGFSVIVLLPENLRINIKSKKEK